MNNFIKNNITVVIPTYNAERTINNTLSIVTKKFKNVIIVDGYSQDLTIDICKKYKIKIFKSKKNRGKQLNLGAKKVLTTWILFLHADSVIQNDIVEEIKKFISIKNKYKAAAFKLKFDQNNIYSRCLSSIVLIRSKYLKLPYGDQGLLISKLFYKKSGITKTGMPVAIQFVGRHFEEDTLVRAGHAYQRETDWHNQHPVL